MKPKEFIDKVDDAAVIGAIAAVEKRTSAEIRVFISQRDLGTDDIMARATARFAKLGMTQTRDHNAVLLYFVPRAQKFAVVGDSAAHAKCGQVLWEQAAAEIHDHLSKGAYTRAIVAAIEMVGAALQTHFPRKQDDRNELPDEPVRD